MHTLRYAYNTNGCAHHRLADALDLIATHGYQGVALTLDWQHLDPFAADWQAQTGRLATKLTELDLSCVIETGARYLLNPSQKHEPTLINPSAEGRSFRQQFLRRAVDIARIVNAETVSFWAGIKQPTVTDTAALSYLGEGLLALADYADAQQVQLSFEPEPGMFIETNADYDRLLGAYPALDGRLHLALDLGHVWVTGEDDPVHAIHHYADRLGTISIEGMQAGEHLHLPLDQGDMAIPPLLEALQHIRFDRLVCVELSRESPRAHLAIPESIRFLRQTEASLGGGALLQ